MRKLRNFSIVLFILAAALFAFFRFREMSLQDRSGPQIVMDADLISVSINDPESKLLEGITATDAKDGDVTDTLIVENLSTFLRPGTRLVRYAAFDNDMHVSRAEREIAYTDYRNPEFSITEPLVFNAGNSNLLQNVTVSDCLDGDLSDTVKILSDSELLIDVPGDYNVRLKAANSAGDVAYLPVIITIREGQSNNAPKIRLDNYVLYLNPGEEFDPYSLISEISIGNTVYELVEGEGNYGEEDLDPEEPVVVGTDQIRISDMPDTSTPGNYTVTYSMTVPVGRYGEQVTGSANLYVVVRDIPVP